MTHEYTLLLNGRVRRARDPGDATAIAWAADTILAVGSDEEVTAISRGDSRFVDLAGATVVPLAGDGALEVGAPVLLAILPTSSSTIDEALAVVRDGRVVSGSLGGIEERMRGR